MWIWSFITFFMGTSGSSKNLGNDTDSKIGEENRSSTGAATGSGETASRRKIRTLHDGDEGADKRSAYYNGNQLDFEPKKGEELNGKEE